jgi:hypothetical protein
MTAGRRVAIVAATAIAALLVTAPAASAIDHNGRHGRGDHAKHESKSHHSESSRHAESSDDDSSSDCDDTVTPAPPAPVGPAM